MRFYHNFVVVFFLRVQITVQNEGIFKGDFTFLLSFLLSPLPPLPDLRCSLAAVASARVNGVSRSRRAFSERFQPRKRVFFALPTGSKTDNRATPKHKERKLTSYQPPIAFPVSEKFKKIPLKKSTVKLMA